MKILIVEDDELVLTILRKYLPPQHYILDAVTDGEMGWSYGSSFEYDLIILDILLPSVDGISLCRRFRSEGFLTPILLLTSQNTLSAKVQGLDAGADDFVVKPFEQAELCARIRALLRRSNTNPLPILTWGELLLNLNTYEVSYCGQPLSLTAIEYDLLELLLRDSQHVFSSDEIIDRLWSSEEYPSEATVRSHIRRIRQKLAKLGAPKDFLATLHGRGYFLKTPSTEESKFPISNLTKLENRFSSTKDSMPELPATLQYQASHNLFSPSQIHQQYINLLNEQWKTKKEQCLEQLHVLSQHVFEMNESSLSSKSKKSAHMIAHKLAGTLGFFGLINSMNSSLQLEELLDKTESFNHSHISQMQKLLACIYDQVNETKTIQLRQDIITLLVVVISESEINKSLFEAASKQGVIIKVVLFSDLNKSRLSLVSELNIPKRHLKSILWKLPSSLEHNSCDLSDVGINQFIRLYKLIQNKFPDIPITVMGDRSKVFEKTNILAKGIELFLDDQTSSESVIKNIIMLLGCLNIPNKVMILDDDHDLLQTLSAFLKPQGFNVTTLADTHQFWTVLHAAKPDALVLDINMPQINGFEICKLVRSDPSWQNLPILFLSVLTDSASQKKAFQVGADDYLHKPIMGLELVSRIQNRLKRRNSSLKNVSNI